MMVKQFFRNILLFILFLCAGSAFLFAQKKTKDNWLVSKISGNPKKVNASVALTLKNEIIPQAFDRNFKGEFLFISQKVPPAIPVESWQLGRYKSEKEMMQVMEDLAIKQYVPVGIDVQKDGAFVQYVKNGLQVSNVRVIKVNDTKEMINTIDVYQKLGYFLNGLSTFEEQLWILFVKYQNLSVDDFVIRVLSDDASSLNELMKKGLKKSTTQIAGLTFTLSEQVIAVFTEKK